MDTAARGKNGGKESRDDFRHVDTTARRKNGGEAHEQESSAKHDDTAARRKNGGKKSTSEASTEEHGEGHTNGFRYVDKAARWIALRLLSRFYMA